MQPIFNLYAGIRSLFLASLLLFIPQSLIAAAPSSEKGINWQAWSPEAFGQARAQNKPILLNLEAVWCHWCHVMDQETYSDPKIIEQLTSSYIAIKVDHDARPDLAQRYDRWGWPATIIFAADGTEIVKRAGYIAPEPFGRLLAAVLADPSPESAAAFQPVTAATSALLSPKTRKALLKNHENSYDPDKGGLKLKQKFLDRDSVEYALVQSANGNAAETEKARKTLDGALNLLDPAWGGFYQYSTHGDWKHPHFEKIMLTQAGYLRIYAQAFALYGEQRYRNAAERTAEYLANFLTSADGALYASQDADLVQGEHSGDYFALNDIERRKRGIPRVDKNIYARNNGWVIEALATLFDATGEQRWLTQAERAAAQMLKTRRLADGGFKHDANDPAGPYLGDSLAMGRALLSLHRSTGDRERLTQAIQAADFIIKRFQAAQGGFYTALADGSPVKPIVDLDENISAARFFNLLDHYTGNDQYRRASELAMRFVATPEVALSRIEDAGILLADTELANDPAHFTVVGPKEADQSKVLYQHALSVPGWYKRVEWLDRAEGPLAHDDVPYPNFDRIAGYACADGRCSLPAFTPEQYKKRIESFE